MTKDLKVIQPDDIVSESRPDINHNFQQLKSNFAGSTYPDNPVQGQRIFKDGHWETYDQDAWKPDPALHNHDERYFTEGEINTLLAQKSDVGHSHDDTYYTEDEVNLLLAEKAAKNHAHDDRYFTETEVTQKLETKSDVGHSHPEHYTREEVETKLDTKSNVDHSHDSRYYTESEINSKLSTINTAIASKLGAGSTAANASKLAGQTSGYYRCSGCSWTCSTYCTGGCSNKCTACTGCSSCTGRCTGCSGDCSGCRDH
ncbi:hypothetical protein [Desulfoluna butyratoxydans]|uniref:Uncharacterized protein n=1 Tax=Desulfoluna butyratoxydans TaxID=231438 RepID=A0A4U8YJN0_9BACT|nr:hypothetical protein [Desulfoluna butyratoxydans]VFQ43851.1 hypothetical protein MSL71_14920 [Desulfoluna butyratoxydans]